MFVRGPPPSSVAFATGSIMAIGAAKKHCLMQWRTYLAVVIPVHTYWFPMPQRNRAVHGHDEGQENGRAGGDEEGGGDGGEAVRSRGAGTSPAHGACVVGGNCSADSPSGWVARKNGVTCQLLWPPVLPAKLATIVINSDGSTGLDTCIWNPERIARRRSSDRAYAAHLAALASASITASQTP